MKVRFMINFLILKKNNHLKILVLKSKSTTTTTADTLNFLLQILLGSLIFKTTKTYETMIELNFS